MKHFVTYFDSNYLALGLSLHESLQKHLGNNFKLFVLCLDTKVEEFINRHKITSCQTISLTDLEKFDNGLYKTKPDRKIYEYYFTITPCIIKYIIVNHPEIETITYLDADIYFFGSPQPLFEELGGNSIYIVPHFFSDKNKHLESAGKYNVVFNSFRNDEDGLKCLNWWREKCIEWCFDYYEEERYADQKYLDRFPEKFDNVVICSNRGANLANFNNDNTTIQLSKKNVLVNGVPLIFYHFHKLRKEGKNLYNPHFQTTSDFKNKALVYIYMVYIKRLRFFEKKYNLTEFSPERYPNKISKGKKSLRKVTFNHYLICLPLYAGYIHLETYLNPLFITYRFIKRIWQNSST